MEIFEINNVRYVNESGTMINMDLTTDRFGIIPFTASPDDVEEHGRQLFARAKAGEFGPVAPFTE